MVIVDSAQDTFEIVHTAKRMQVYAAWTTSTRGLIDLCVYWMNGQLVIGSPQM